MDLFEEFEWEEEEKSVKIGDWVGNPGMDWDLEVYWPCIVMKFLPDDKVLLGEALSFRYNDKRHYTTTKISKLQIWDEKTQDKYNNKLKKKMYPSPEGWLKFLKEI